MFVSIYLILAIVAYLDLELYQNGVKKTFLNGKLDEEIYTNQLKDFVVKGQEHKLYKFKLSIYGLNQSSRTWYIRLHRDILLNEFMIITKDHYIYVRQYIKIFILLSLRWWYYTG